MEKKFKKYYNDSTRTRHFVIHSYVYIYKTIYIYTHNCTWIYNYTYSHHTHIGNYTNINKNTNNFALKLIEAGGHRNQSC